MKQRFEILMDKAKPVEQRVFALLELFCMPMSFLTLIGLVAVVIVKRCGVVLPVWFDSYAFPIMVSAAVGYLTNWIAIEMLFKPYNPTWKHPFAIITFGYWRQGLVPKNKDRIAQIMGTEVAEKLLKPEKLANDLCSMVGEILENKEIMTSLQQGLQKQVVQHEEQIISALVPKIEAAVISETNRLITPEKIKEFWSKKIEPYLQSEKTREKISTFLLNTLEKKAPTIAEKVKPIMVQAIEEYCYTKAGRLGVILSPLASSIADYLISQKTIEMGITKWINNPTTPDMVRDEIVNFVAELREQIYSSKNEDQTSEFAEELRETLHAYISKYLHENIRSMSGKFLSSDALWSWVESLLPTIKPGIESMIKETGMPLIIEKLNVNGRIQTAVDEMDMAEFHDMINLVAAQHLGAIQVLGYILGAVAGILLIFG